jgi:hypothetical protein
MKKKERCEALLCLVGEAHTPNRTGLRAWLAIKEPRPLWFFLIHFKKKIILSDKLFITANDLSPDLLVFNHMLKIF